MAIALAHDDFFGSSYRYILAGMQAMPAYLRSHLRHRIKSNFHESIRHRIAPGLDYRRGPSAMRPPAILYNHAIKPDGRAAAVAFQEKKLESWGFSSAGDATPTAPGSGSAKGVRVKGVTLASLLRGWFFTRLYNRGPGGDIGGYFSKWKKKSDDDYDL